MPNNMQSKLISIADVSDYGDQIIQGKVTFRKDLAQTKAGKNWFSFTLDDGTCDIKVTCFDKAEEFFPLVEKNAFIRLEKAQFRYKSAESKKFDRSRSEYEAQLRPVSVISKVETQALVYNAETLLEVKARTSNLIKDQDPDDTTRNEVANIIVHTSTLTRNEGQSAGRAWVNYQGDCFDQSGEHLRITIWQGAEELQIDQIQNTCVGVVRCGVRISKKYGTSLQTGQSSEIVVGQKIESVFKGGAEALQFRNSQQFEIVKSAKQERNMPGSPGLAQDRTTDFGDCKSAQGPRVVKLIGLVQFEADVERATYEGCDSCRKKECGCENRQLRHYFKTNATVSDYSGAFRVTFFDNQAVQILGMSANEFSDLDEARKQMVLSKLVELELLVRQQPAQGEQRERMAVLKAVPVNDAAVDFLGHIGHLCQQLGGAAAQI